MSTLAQTSHGLHARLRTSVATALIYLLVIGFPSATARRSTARDRRSSLLLRNSRIHPSNKGTELDDEETEVGSPESRLRCNSKVPRCPGGCHCIVQNDGFDGTCQNVTVLRKALRSCNSCEGSSDCAAGESCVLKIFPEVSFSGQHCSSCFDDAEREARHACLTFCKESDTVGTDSRCDMRTCWWRMSADLEGPISSVTHKRVICTCRCCEGRTAICEADKLLNGTIEMERCRCMASETTATSRPSPVTTTGTATVTATATPTKTGVETPKVEGEDEPPCVGTSWLLAHGHGSGVLQNHRATQVLCIRDSSVGLPCGTAGHLLRVCTPNGACRLESYAEVCAKRGGCMTTLLPVSRLRLSADWSGVTYSDEHGSLSLTALSVRPFASRLSPSFLVAFIAHGMVRMGLGGVLDAAIVAAEGAQGAREAVRAVVAR